MIIPAFGNKIDQWTLKGKNFVQGVSISVFSKKLWDLQVVPPELLNEVKHTNILRKWKILTFFKMICFDLNWVRKVTNYLWGLYKVQNTKKRRMIGVLKGAPNAWSRPVKIDILLSCERAHSDKFIHTGESVKLGLVWQTEAFECRKNSFS